MNVRFYELAVGAVFEFGGERYQKSAMSMAQDERRWGSVFMGETEVVSDGPMLPPETAAMWRPERGHWAALIEGMVACA
jgi:hypothetical protein